MAEGGEKTKNIKEIISEIGTDDLYEFLGIDSCSSEKEINGGYRKRARKYHPDKNPDPQASEMFQKLAKAYEVLSEPATKAAYDKFLKAKLMAKKKHEELNAKRRKLKETLEMRESQGSQSSVDEALAAQMLEKKLERLREENFQKVRENKELLEKRFKQQQPSTNNEDILPTLKVSWRAKKSDPSNGGYTQELLEEELSKSGGLHHVLISKKKKGKAMASFLSIADAKRAIQSECGLRDNPLQFDWIGGEPPVNTVASSREVPATSHRSLEEDIDYEELTMMKLRQAQERKQLAEQLQNESQD